MMTTVAGHSSKDVIMTMVAKMMRRMTQISKMCLGSIASMGISLTVSIFLHSATEKKQMTILYHQPVYIVRDPKFELLTSHVIFTIAQPRLKR